MLPEGPAACVVASAPPRRPASVVATSIVPPVFRGPSSMVSASIVPTLRRAAIRLHPPRGVVPVVPTTLPTSARV